MVFSIYQISFKFINWTITHGMFSHTSMFFENLVLVNLFKMISGAIKFYFIQVQEKQSQFKKIAADL